MSSRGQSSRIAQARDSYCDLASSGRFGMDETVSRMICGMRRATVIPVNVSWVVDQVKRVRVRRFLGGDLEGEQELLCTQTCSMIRCGSAVLLPKDRYNRHIALSKIQENRMN